MYIFDKINVLYLLTFTTGTRRILCSLVLKYVVGGRGNGTGTY